MITFMGTGGLVVVDVEYVTDDDANFLVAQAHPSARRSLRGDLIALQRHELTLIATATDEQWAITWGACFRRTYTGPMTLGGRLTIYGRVHTLDEIAAAERATGASDREIRQVMARIRGAYERGWRHGRCYSAVTPEGELGDTHVAHMTPLTPGGFDAARQAGWPA